MRNWIFCLLMLSLSFSLSSQLIIGGQTLYGNEWINYDKTYIKVTVDQDGMYKLTYSELLAAGIPTGVIGSGIQVVHMGEQVTSFVSSDLAWRNGDFIAFHGGRNRGELDAHLFEDPETDQLNPNYSIFSDDGVYFISWGNAPASAERYSVLDNDLSNNNVLKKNFYLHKEEMIFSERDLSPKAPQDSEVAFSSFVPVEGFATNLRSQHSFTIPVEDIANGPQALFNYRFGTNAASHNILAYFNDKLLETHIFSGGQIVDRDHLIDLVDLKNNSTVDIESSRNTDLSNIASLTLTYPRTPDAKSSQNVELFLQENAVNTYYEFENFSGTNTNYVFDITNGQMLNPVMEGNTAKFLIERSGPAQSQVFLMNENSFLSAKSLETKQFVNHALANAEYLILTSERLDVEENGVNYIQEFADFRASNLGGSYNTYVIHSEDLCDQFGYGISGHSLAIRNFSNYIRTQWPDFGYAFIIGKGLDWTNKNKQTLLESFVPTYGQPGSDNLLFAEKDKTFPFVSVGRLAAKNPTEIRDYLDKVTVHAAISDVENLSIEERLWRKNIIHLSGGGPAEQGLLFNILGQMTDTIENNSYGANVTTYRKTSSDPVQTSLSQQIVNQIDEGISWLTFFGHSSQGTFDFSVEDPDKYDNYGRWPFILAMGCRAGDINANLISLSEKMVLTKDKGAIAFIASSGSAYISPLAEMGTEFYDFLGDEYYGLPVGDAMRQVLEDQFRPNNSSWATLHEQNLLHGDPAVEIFSAPAEDYVVDFATIQTKDEIGTQDETFDISFDVVNLGRGGTQGTMSNFLVHSYGENSNDTIFFTTPATSNRVSVDLVLDNPGFESVGKNTINIVLDYDNKYEELPAPVAENNNDLKTAYNNEGYCFFIFDNSAFPIYPTDFAIVNRQDISLKASTSNAFGKEQIYVLEIDTTELFNSGLLISSEVTSLPGIIEWSPQIQFENNKVYYWRIIPKDVENTIWNTSSFIYLEDSSEGWSQSHLYQWQKDDFSTLEFTEDSRTFNFEDNVQDVEVTNIVHHGPNTENPVFKAQNDPQEYLEFISDGNIRSGVYISILDRNTGNPWLNQPVPNSLYGSVVGSAWAANRFFFPYTTRTHEERELAMAFLEDVVPDGNYVVFYTVQRDDVTVDGQYEPEEWASDAAVVGRDLFSVLERQGAQRVRELENGAKPYIFAYRKGDPSWAPIEVIADDVDSRIEAKFDILAKWDEGSVVSRTIGPAQAWDQLLWDIDAFETGEDLLRLSIIGIDANGQDSVLVDDVDDFDFDLSFINAEQYPNLRLNLYSADSESRTSAQMEYWRVLYETLPEAVLNTAEKFAFNNDTLQIGQPLTLSTVATNITSTDMDSLLVKYTIVDASNSEVVEYNKEAPLRGGESVEIDFEYPTSGLNGLHQFIVEINPDEDQPEQYKFNNIGLVDFAVLGDQVNPILDVTFDGIHILDGDIVSPTPNITVILRDENEQFLIRDISSFDLALQKLPDPQSFPVDLSAGNVIFTPSDSLTDFAKLEFLPELESGEYILFVQGTDASGNLSGDQDIEIRFQVVNESAVSNVLNYPNPFSTSTQFVFTLTGVDVPDVFTIQIMTLTGKVVKEITKEEMGNLRIGVNRTDYKWNGTDEFGNKLGNGVYLYRVFSSHDDGEEINQFNNQEIDSFFTKGFGKLVIMR